MSIIRFGEISDSSEGLRAFTAAVGAAIAENALDAYGFVSATHRYAGAIENAVAPLGVTYHPRSSIFTGPDPLDKDEILRAIAGIDPAAVITA
jgi:hypothetical protein